MQPPCVNQPSYCILWAIPIYKQHVPAAVGARGLSMELGKMLRSKQWSRFPRPSMSGKPETLGLYILQRVGLAGTYRKDHRMTSIEGTHLTKQEQVLPE